MTFSVLAMTVIARSFNNISALAAASLSALLSAMVAWPFGDPLAVTGHELLVLALFGVVNLLVGLGLFTVGARFCRRSRRR